jgi:hypothetical protein
MKLRSGKYAGMQVTHVQQIAPGYIAWVEQNRPEMLRERKVAKPKGNSIPRMDVWAGLEPNWEYDTTRTD